MAGDQLYSYWAFNLLFRFIISFLILLIISSFSSEFIYLDYSWFLINVLFLQFLQNTNAFSLILFSLSFHNLFNSYNIYSITLSDSVTFSFYRFFRNDNVLSGIHDSISSEHLIDDGMFFRHHKFPSISPYKAKD